MVVDSIMSSIRWLTPQNESNSYTMQMNPITTNVSKSVCLAFPLAAFRLYVFNLFPPPQFYIHYTQIKEAIYQFDRIR